MKYQVTLNQNGKIVDVVVEEAKNLQEAKILAKQQNSKCTERQKRNELHWSVPFLHDLQMNTNGIFKKIMGPWL